METAAEDPLTALLASLRLDVGVSWVCWACSVQSCYVYPSVDAARHDAAGHALGLHQDRLALSEIALRLVSEEEQQVRTDALLGGPPMVPPVEDPYLRPDLSPLQQELVCDAIGCPPNSRHRRRRPPLDTDEAPVVLIPRRAGLAACPDPGSA
ncbi:hypothetical protein ACIOJE_35170 [Kitasatospora sp. NPDC087861]|uniref:hypothetical protein n=1 Tax=Kitasatospora sp. NPDC087861 TaxID=3364070 RepID=UPI0038041E36